MISLKRYLDSSSLESDHAGKAVSADSFAVALEVYGSALLEMGNCSLDACPGTDAGLKQALAQLQTELTPAISSEKLAANGELMREQLRSWSGGMAHHYQAKAGEVRDMLLTVARTAESVGARDQRCAGRMNAVTERLKAIASLEDLTEIRASIDKSSTELKASIDRMTEEGKAVLDHLRTRVEEYQAKLDEAEKTASRDALTGASSRVYVECQIEKHVESSAPFCVAVVDLDGFKKVNDEHGHLIGDELLKQFAGELRSACRSTDVIGRWGGDEFILLFNGGLEEAEAQTERVRKWVCGNYSVTGKQGALKLRVNASIGLAAHVAGETMKDLLARADAAMYEQKATTRIKAA
ncbi:MAG: GGDEF domain-containing protein [Terracidiphilus sp.]